MVGDGEEGVGIGREINADDFGFFVDHVVNETGVLVAEAVVVLAPDERTEQVIQRGNGPPPGNMARDLEPFGVLIEHRIHNVDEGLVAGEESVPAGQQVALQPAFALMFA